MSTIAWIGLGRMGLPMATHLRLAGHEVRGYDASDVSLQVATDAGITPVASVAEAVDSANIVITSLPDPKTVQEVYFGPQGLIELSQPGAILIDTSTSSPSLAREIHEAARAREISALDAPVSGGPMGAKAGDLAVMVGGERETFDEVYEPVFMEFGSLVRFMGNPGAGQSTKLVNNLLAGVYMTAISEGLALAVLEQLDPVALFEVLTNGTGDSKPLRTRFPIPGARPETPASNNWNPLFPVSLIRKDLSLAKARADELGLDLPTVEHALKQYDAAIEKGWGNQDYSIISELVRNPK